MLIPSIQAMDQLPLPGRHAPETVYRHRTHGWSSFRSPIADDTEVARKAGCPEDCRTADAWWGIDDDATLVESAVVDVVGGPARLFAKATPHEERWVYLVAVFDAPFITRDAFETAMVRFAEAGFPQAPRFQLRSKDPPVNLSD